MRTWNVIVEVILAFIVLAIPLLAQPTRGANSDTTITLEGDGYAFSVSIPPDWKLAPGSGTWTGTTAILSPRVDTANSIRWGNPDVWITIGVAKKASYGNRSMEEMVSYYARIDSQEGARTMLEQPWETASGQQVLVRRSDAPRRYGERAFIEDSRFITVMELRRFDEGDFKQARPIFMRIVRSYRTAGEKR